MKAPLICQTPREVHAWMRKHLNYVSKYTVVENTLGTPFPFMMKLNDEKGVRIDLRNKKITHFPFQFGDIDSFDCANNLLTSLAGAPPFTWSSFDCADNRLTDLVGGPEKVLGRYCCAKNKLTSLKGAPKDIFGYFDCSRNLLTSLKGAPSTVQSTFDCQHNELTSLEGGPKFVSINYYANDNPLETLLGCETELGQGLFVSNPSMAGIEVFTYDKAEKIYLADEQDRLFALEKLQLEQQIQPVAVRHSSDKVIKI